MQDEKTSDTESLAPTKKRTNKKRGIVGIVVGVIAVAAVGFWVWHNDPSFCSNPVCHSTMNPYVQTFGAEVDSAAIDKWGNAVSNSHAMLAVSHKQSNLACLDCHVPSLGQQVGEVMTQLTGNYYLPLEEVDGLALMENAGQTSDSGRGDEFCLRSGCHELTRRDLTERTANLSFNPHAWQHAQNECTECHKSHRASTLVCTECHAEAAAIMPDGWIDAAAGKRIHEAIYG